MFGEFCVILVKMLSKISDNFAWISGNFMNILKKFKQLLKKFCVNFVQVKCRRVNYGENFQVIQREYQKILMKYLEKFKEDWKQFNDCFTKCTKLGLNSECELTFETSLTL